jgi:aldose 1-epimerase
MFRDGGDCDKTVAMTSASPAFVVLQAGPCSVTIDLAHGGRLGSWKVHGLELLEQKSADNHPFGWGSYPMVPWAGRVRQGSFAVDGTSYTLPINAAPHAMHGTTYDVPWTHLTGGSDWAMLGLRLDSPWPLGGSATHLLHLGPDSLTQTLTVVAGDRPMPVVVGWHPWFRRQLERGVPLELDIDTAAAEQLYRDGDFMPSGKVGPVRPKPWDDCFTGVNEVGLRWDGALRIDMTHECENVVIYDPEHAICVEPQSGPPDAFNSDPDECRLDSGEVLERSVTWRWTMASQQ